MSNKPASLAGQPRIQHGLDFVQRWEANVLLNGLVSGERAHRILLEIVRRISQDRPSDAEAAFDRLHDLQTYLNNTTTVPPLTPTELVDAFEAAKQAITTAEPWHGPSRWKQPGRPRVGRPSDRRVPPGQRATHIVHSGGD
jgi:hypothetical protein